MHPIVQNDDHKMFLFLGHRWMQTKSQMWIKPILPQFRRRLPMSQLWQSLQKMPQRRSRKLRRMRRWVHAFRKRSGLRQRWIRKSLEYFQRQILYLRWTLHCDGHHFPKVNFDCWSIRSFYWSVYSLCRVLFAKHGRWITTFCQAIKTSSFSTIP